MPTYYLIAIDGQGLEGLNNAIVSYQYHEGTEFTNTGIKMNVKPVHAFPLPRLLVPDGCRTKM